MAIIHPFSDSTKYSTGGIWAANATNFPACKVFFPCNEIAGTAILTDTQQGSTLTSASLTKPDANSIATTSGLQTTSGTAIAINAPFFLFAVAKGSFPTIRLGQSTGTFIQLASTGGIIQDGSSNAQATATAYTLNTVGTIYGRANVLTAFNTSTGQTSYEFTTTTTASALANTATDNTSSGGIALANPMSNLTFGASGWNAGGTTAIYGIAFFRFTAIPSDLKAGLAWMTYQWSVGNKWIYPGWKGVS